MLTADAPIDAPAAEAVMARARTENFSVASRVLPRRERAHLLAVYGFARLVDELGDAPAGARSDADAAASRLAALDWLERELDAAFRGEAASSPASSPEGEGEHPLLVRLGETVRACSLPREPFARLIEANRVDQRVSRYETWAQLREYCALSADPVGEIVLGVFGLATHERVALSDSICTALQLTEHCQDVAEDFARGRVYLPAEDMRRFGVGEAELADAHASAPLRELLAFEAARARRLFDEGAPLIAQLKGRPRVAVAAFLAGGRAALDAIERARYDVLAGPPRAGTGRRLVALAGTLRASRAVSRGAPA
ncbi:MAG TPA: squalene synthase HpnC [Solirubrobacteraceae bacterium]|jgi:squalene synthase HpnC|nr:squalene synthase HpnC [Solirubrobacteraceae bacterium]